MIAFKEHGIDSNFSNIISLNSKSESSRVVSKNWGVNRWGIRIHKRVSKYSTKSIWNSWGKSSYSKGSSRILSEISGCTNRCGWVSRKETRIDNIKCDCNWSTIRGIYTLVALKFNLMCTMVGWIRRLDYNLRTTSCAKGK